MYTAKGTLNRDDQLKKYSPLVRRLKAVDENTKVIYQGLTGSQGSFYGQRNADYGTQVVAGTHPKKAGTEVNGVPIYATVAGMRTTQLSVNGEAVNVTSKDSGGWRELLHFLPCKDDYKLLGKSLDPPLTAKEAKKSVDLLASLGLVQRDAAAHLVLVGGAFGRVELELLAGGIAVEAGVADRQAQQRQAQATGPGAHFQPPLPLQDV